MKSNCKSLNNKVIQIFASATLMLEFNPIKF